MQAASIFYLPLNWYVTLVIKGKINLFELFQSFKTFLLKISILKLNLEDACFLSAFSYRENGVEGKKNLGY